VSDHHVVERGHLLGCQVVQDDIGVGVVPTVNEDIVAVGQLY